MNKKRTQLIGMGPLYICNCIYYIYINLNKKTDPNLPIGETQYYIYILYT